MTFQNNSGLIQSQVATAGLSPKKDEENRNSIKKLENS